MAIKDLGAVTAYAYAVQHGYTGTEEEFEELMALLPQKVNDAQDKIDEIADFNVEVTTGAAGSQASASYNHANSKLSLTIPRGDTGEISQEFVDENLAYNDGYYDSMTVGSAEQLVSSIMEEDTKPYVFRTTGGRLDVGDRKTEELVGGTIAWNQRVSIGKIRPTEETDGVTRTNNGDGSITLSGTASASNAFPITYTLNGEYIQNHIYLLSTGRNSLEIYDGYGVDGFTSSGYLITKWNRATAAGAVYARVVDGVTYSGKVYPQIFDLTQMFGTTIADYIYSLEQAEAGAGVAWFKKYFPKPYYAYNAGSLKSVNVASGINTGFNQWDEEWDIGDIDGVTGEFKTGRYLRSKNLIKVLPNTNYYLNIPSLCYFYEYDINGVAIVNNGSYAYHQISASRIYTTSENTHYLAFRNNVDNASQSYGSDICINLHWDGERDGEYEPYDAHVYNYDSDLELRGIPSLDEFGNLQYDGDIYEPDGTVRRRYVDVDLGSLNWQATQTATDMNGRTVYYSSANSNIQFKTVYATELKNAIASIGRQLTAETIVHLDVSEFSYTLDNSAQGTVWALFIDNARSAAEVKSFFNGHHVVVEIKTPTTEEADPFTSPQVINDFGTEEWVDAGVQAETRDVTVPVGHNSAYMVNLKAKLEMAPNSPDGDGEYLVRQKDGENEYIPFSWSGDHLDLTAGSAHQLISTVQENDQSPYLFRTSGGAVDIGDREFINGIVGGTVAWNQLVHTGDFSVTTGWTEVGEGTTKSVSNNIITVTNPNGAAFFGFRATSDWNGKTVAGHKYLLTIDVKASVSSISVYNPYYDDALFANVTKTKTIGTNWETLASIVSCTSAGSILLGVRKTSGNYGSEVSLYAKNAMIFDLTQMFGSTIADYIYSLEQATAGAGVAFFRKLFPKPYYEYNAGELLSVSGLQSHDMTGFNQWDEEWRNGYYYSDSGIFAPESTKFANKNLIAVIPNTTYYIGSSVNATWTLFFYDAEGNFVKHGSQPAVTNDTFTTPSDAHYMNFCGSTTFYGTTYNHDICINLAWDNSRNGEYEPYVKHSYPLDNSLELRGIPKLDANNELYYDGDIYEADGTVTRKYGIVDLGTLSWANEMQSLSTLHSASLPNFTTKTAINIAILKYVNSGNVAWVTQPNMTYQSYHGKLYIRDDAYVNGAAFKTAMSGVYAVYPLNTPTTEEAEPYQTPQIVDDFGTEEFVIDSEIAVPVPVGHDTDYPINLVAKLEMAPNSPDGDGDYVVRQVNGENEYVPLVIPSELPTAPTENGSYVLKVTVANGTPTYSWEAQS